MTKPVRLRLSRKRGFNLQRYSRAVNGLAAVSVARPSFWGNDFIVGRDGTVRQCVAKYRKSIIPVRSILTHELRGKNLACWCGKGPCHADVLLEIANR